MSRKGEKELLELLGIRYPLALPFECRNQQHNMNGILEVSYIREKKGEVEVIATMHGPEHLERDFYAGYCLRCKYARIGGETTISTRYGNIRCIVDGKVVKYGKYGDPYINLIILPIIDDNDKYFRRPTPLHLKVRIRKVETSK
jgi:hypothetical protein